MRSALSPGGPTHGGQRNELTEEAARGRRDRFETADGGRHAGHGKGSERHNEVGCQSWACSGDRNRAVDALTDYATGAALFARTWPAAIKCSRARATRSGMGVGCTLVK